MRKFFLENKRKIGNNIFYVEDFFYFFNRKRDLRSSVFKEWERKGFFYIF